MRIIDVKPAPTQMATDFLIRVPMREFVALHGVGHRPMGEGDFAGLIKKYTKRHHRVRWAKKARRKRRARGV